MIRPSVHPRRLAQTQKRRPTSLRPVIEAIEDRQLLSALFTVTHEYDSGPGTLRQAILDANATPATPTDPNVINFDIPALVNTFSVSGANPLTITPASDGNVWFTTPGAVGRLTPTGLASLFPSTAQGVDPTGSLPQGIVTGPIGGLFFTDANPSVPRFSSIHPAILGTANTNLPAGTVPGAIAYGSDLNLWFVDDNPAAPAIWRVNGGGQASPPSPFGLPGGSHPTDITPGPDGELWFTDNGSTPAVWSINTVGGRRQFNLPAGSNPLGIVTGPDGNLWFTDDDPSAPAIGRISTSGNITLFPLAAGSQPNKITAASDGYLYYTLDGANRGIGRISTSGVSDFYAFVKDGADPVGITTGPDGKVYFTEPSTGKIGQISLNSAVTITPLTPLPEITNIVDLNGDTQPGSKLNTVVVTLHSPNRPENAVRQIILDGSQAGAGAVGISVHGSDGHVTSNSLINGLVIQNFATGISLADDSTASTGAEGVGIFDVALLNNSVSGLKITSSNNNIGGNTEGFRSLVEGNGVGIDLAGSIGTGNRVEGFFIIGNQQDGVRITTSNNVIGDGGIEGGLNVISGNNRGVHILPDPATPTVLPHGNEVLGNLIGTGVDGYSALPNTVEGVFVDNAPGNLIGGGGVVAGNVILGNAIGVHISGTNGTSNRLLGNYIGFNQGGVVTLFIGNQLGVLIESRGNYVGFNSPGAGNTISTNKDAGVVLSGAGATGNFLLGNMIGLNPAGGSDFGNTNDGVRILNAHDNTIGGTDPLSRNTISGNNWGITISGPSSTGNIILGNYIGTEADGVHQLGNALDGIRILDAPDNIIGGTAVGATNVISGNNRGVTISGVNATRNVVAGNFIGTDLLGLSPAGNQLDGVYIAAGASGNTIGGTAPGAGNTIEFNVGNGVRIDSGNADAITSNKIYGNNLLGIDLGGDGVTPNHPGGGLAGPNDLVNYPVLSAVVTTPAAGLNSGAATIEGTYNGAPNTTYTLQFFTNAVADPTNYGEGQTLVGTATVTTDGAGNAPILVTFKNALPPGQFVSATATAPNGSTSEFSNDVPDVPIQVQFRVSGYTVLESAGTATIQVTRTGGTQGTVSVHYATSNGTGFAGVDYTPVAGTITFNPGEVSKSFTVPILNDGRPDPDETVALALSNPTNGASLGDPNTATLLIQDTNSPTIQFATPSPSVREDAGTATVVVTRNVGVGTATVAYATGGGTAVAGVDYTPVAGTVTFNPGETSKTFTIPVLNDGRPDPNETVGLFLSSPTGGRLGAPGAATLTILDTNQPGALQFVTGHASVNESTGKAQVVVTRVGGAVGTVTVAYATVDGNARAGVDYLPVAGTLTFKPGQTTQVITVPLVDSTLFKGNRAFGVILGHPGGGATLGAPNGEVVTIVDDNISTVQFAATSTIVSETAGVALVSVSRTGTGTALVGYYTAAGDAVPGVNYMPVGGLLTFAPGEFVKTIAVPVLHDGVVTGPKAVGLFLMGIPGGASLGTPAASVLMIQNTDFDLTPPTVRSVQPISNGAAVVGVAVTYSEAMDPVRAQNLFNYDAELTLPGRDGRFNTVDDLHVPIVAATYNPANFTVILTPAVPLPANTPIRVTIDPRIVPGAVPGVSDLAGNLLDATGTGLPGGTYQAIIGPVPQPSAFAFTQGRRRR